MPRVIFRNCYNVISRAVGRVKFDITSGIYAKYHHKSCHYLFIHKRFVIFTCIKHFKLMYQSIPAAPTSSSPPPGLLRAICSPFQSQGWGICKFCAARVPGICQPRGYSRAFEPHEVSYQNITTQRITEEKEGHRAVTAFSRFYTCISSLLIKIELHRERHPFTFIKLFITCNFTAPIILISISFNVNNFISILKP